MGACRWLLIGLLAFGGNGCAGYRLGPVSGVAPGTRSVQVNPFTSQTVEPRLGEAVTGQLRSQLQRDGTYRLQKVEGSHERALQYFLAIQQTYLWKVAHQENGNGRV